MTKNRKSRPNKKKGQSRSNQPPPTKNPKTDFVPQEIDITGQTEEESVVFVGGVRPTAKTKARFIPHVTDITEPGNIEIWVGGQQPPPKTKAAFDPREIDETTPGELIGIVGVSIPPKKTIRQRS
jgi:hypothetical protein